MNKDRIQINGVWYVKESSTSLQSKKQVEIDNNQIVWFLGCVYETDEYCWEVNKIYTTSPDSKLYDGVSIKFTDKRFESWKEDCWDSNNWILGVYNNDEDALLEARKVMNEEGIAHFQAFVGKLIEKEWLDDTNQNE